MVTENEQWPPLPYEEWKDTYATLHMWTQIVGKVALAQAPPLNHSWSIALLVTPRGLVTRTLPHGDRTFTMEFDFIDHQLVIRTSEGDVRSVALAPRSVASFYAEVMATLTSMGLPVKIWPMAVEIPVPIRLDTDEAHHTYDAAQANRCWAILSQVARVFEGSRCDFVGKCSPVHFFWGGFDLATTRFSGRPAPLHPGGVPNCADWVMQEAYSHEVSSCGFWPGGSDEGSFYCYAYPEPPGFAAYAVGPGARYDAELGEFVLPYRTVRTSDDPDSTLLAFLQSTYEAAAETGRWDRRALEVGDKA
jgi:Family of unknown function (DUF5996)